MQDRFEGTVTLKDGSVVVDELTSPTTSAPIHRKVRASSDQPRATSTAARRGSSVTLGMGSIADIDMRFQTKDAYDAPLDLRSLTD
jgi:hypothetical protein